MQRNGFDPPTSDRKQLKATGRLRRQAPTQLALTPSVVQPSRNDILPALAVVQCAVDQLTLHLRRLRKSDAAHVREIANAIKTLGFNLPLLIGRNNEIIDGHSRLEAARFLGLTHVPCIRLDHLDANDQRLLRLAINRLAEKGIWDFTELKTEFEELIIESAPVEITGFGIDEIEQIVIGEDGRVDEVGFLESVSASSPISRLGDVWLLGDHRLVCGDATDPNVLAALMRGDVARMAFTDEPFDSAFTEYAAGGIDREFFVTSDEASNEQFLKFNCRWLDTILSHLVDGGVVGTFVDWKRLSGVHAAATSLGLVQIDLIVWTKTSTVAADLYRSQHELLPLFKKGYAPHVHNVSHGKRRRWRSNVWAYPCSSPRASDTRRGLDEESTAKPTAMLEDALGDLSSSAEVILAPFSGTGSVLIACEKTGRRCRAIESDPTSVDFAIRRFQTLAHNKVVLEATGRTFDDVERERRIADRPFDQGNHALNN